MKRDQTKALYWDRKTAGNGIEMGEFNLGQAYAEGRPIVDVAAQMSPLSREEITALLNPLHLTQGGVTAKGSSG